LKILSKKFAAPGNSAALGYSPKAFMGHPGLVIIRFNYALPLIFLNLIFHKISGMLPMFE